MDDYTNFAYSTVIEEPSPGDSGTTLTVSTNDGALFPNVPFNVTVWPSGTAPLSYNAEIMRVVDKDNDVFTVEREQEGTTARTIIPGDQIAASLTEKTLSDLQDIDHTLLSGLDQDSHQQYVLKAGGTFTGSVDVPALEKSPDQPSVIGTSFTPGNADIYFQAPSRSVTVPAGTVPGDMLLLIHATFDHTAYDFTAANGFTKIPYDSAIGSAAGSLHTNGVYWYRIVDTTCDAGKVLTFTATGIGILALIAVRSVASIPHAQGSGLNGASTPANASNSGKRMLISTYVGTALANTAPQNPQILTGETQRTICDGTSSDSYMGVVAIGTRILQSGQSVPVTTWTQPYGHNLHVMTLNAGGAPLIIDNRGNGVAFGSSVSTSHVPTDNGHLTNKGYVDDKVATSGGLSQATADTLYLKLTGGTVSGSIAASTAPTADAHLANKIYVDNRVTAGGGLLDGMSDVNTAGAVDGQVLSYTAGTVTWIGAPTTVTYSAQYTTSYASNAWDNNAATSWNTNDTAAAWTVADFAVAKRASRLFAASTSVADTWKLEGSNDSTTWTPVVSTVVASTGGNTYNFTPATYRYWRMSLVTPAAWRDPKSFTLYDVADMWVPGTPATGGLSQATADTLYANITGDTFTGTVLVPQLEKSPSPPTIIGSVGVGNADGSAATRVITVPTGTVAGDFLLLMQMGWNSGMADFTPTNGFTKYGTGIAGAGSLAIGGQWWSRIADDTMLAGATITFTAARYLGLVVIRGVNSIATAIDGGAGSLTTNANSGSSVGSRLMLSAYIGVAYSSGAIDPYPTTGETETAVTDRTGIFDPAYSVGSRSLTNGQTIPATGWGQTASGYARAVGVIVLNAGGGAPMPIDTGGAGVTFGSTVAAAAVPTSGAHLTNKTYVDGKVPLVLGPATPVPGGTPAGTIIVRTVT